MSQLEASARAGEIVKDGRAERRAGRKATMQAGKASQADVT